MNYHLLCEPQELIRRLSNYVQHYPKLHLRQYFEALSSLYKVIRVILISQEAVLCLLNGCLA